MRAEEMRNKRQKEVMYLFFFFTIHTPYGNLHNSGNTDN